MDTLQNSAQQLGINLTIKQLKTFDAYYHEIVDWNHKFNLTSITGYEEVQTKHFLDSLTAVLAVDFKQALNVIDVGTGAGLPGIPLKIAFPGIKLVLMEATAKKVSFLEHAVKTLGLSGAEIITGRAEEIAHDPQYREKFDVAVSRAVAALPALAELTLPFVKTGGCFIAYKKGGIKEEVQQAGKAIKLMGGKMKEIIPVSPELFDDARHLIEVEKTSLTPPAYPRRPGMPEKRPLLP